MEMYVIALCYMICRYTFKHLDKGEYSFRVRSISLAATGVYTDYAFITIYDQSHSTPVIVGAVFVCLLLLTILGSAIYFGRQMRLRRRVHSASTEQIIMDDYNEKQEQEEGEGNGGGDLPIDQAG